MPTLNEIALKYAQKQPKQIDYITETSPIINSIPYFATTHGLSHAYEVLNSSVAGGFVDMDGQLPEVDSDSQLKWKELSILGGQMEVGEDKAKTLGGAGTYFATKTPSIYKKTSMTAESQLIYNLLQNYAKDNNKLVTSASGASGNKYYSIIAVRWVEQEFCGLYDPAGFEQGTMFSFYPYSGGSVYKSDNKNVYGGYFKSYLGFLLDNPRCIAGVVNIDATADIPDALAQQLSDMLISCRAGAEGNTKIYMHPAMLGKLGKFKDSHLNLMNGDKQLDRRIMGWDGVPIETSYNFLSGTETAITL